MQITLVQDIPTLPPPDSQDAMAWLDWASTFA
jgi:hypothetical protein